MSLDLLPTLQSQSEFSSASSTIFWTISPLPNSTLSSTQDLRLSTLIETRTKLAQLWLGHTSNRVLLLFAFFQKELKIVAAAACSRKKQFKVWSFFYYSHQCLSFALLPDLWFVGLTWIVQLLNIDFSHSSTTFFELMSLVNMHNRSCKN